MISEPEIQLLTKSVSVGDRHWEAHPEQDIDTLYAEGLEVEDVAWIAWDAQGTPREYRDTTILDWSQPTRLSQSRERRISKDQRRVFPLLAWIPIGR
jgi:hypothetical protein